ncbi:MAG: PhoX family protein [Gammaproteobacteria bacterium]|nr:PhoX family protein [Gammaproteobacteria bacterium]MDH4253265.1 PhoX family protein [Gammaproteobacteria bacterium]MDH5308675.1 PhoX family protein [Gammaproteobacteria bacterium]
MLSRRHFLQGIALAAISPRTRASTRTTGGFGPLVPDPQGILDLPAGFGYRIVSTRGDRMDDGLLVPAQADGMAAFPGDDGNIVIVCNHENHPALPERGPFGPGLELIGRIDPAQVYDPGAGLTPGNGGTTTIVYDPKSGATLRRHLSLAGTEYNCAGGPTPWGSWLSCEECFTGPGTDFARLSVVHRDRRHGYVFEVPSSATGPAEPVPLREMGRFEHEAAAVNPASGIVYLTEDQHQSLLYRYIPNQPGALAQGGRLQALAVRKKPSFDTRNWFDPRGMLPNEWMETRWIDLDDVDPDVDDLRYRGFEAGAACFARGEGLSYSDGSLFMTATIGGPSRLGQVFEYRLSTADGTRDEDRRPGQLRLLAESTSDSVLRNADNLTMSPWGDLVICEDTATHCGLVGISPAGSQYPLADNAYTSSELAGACFSPDGKLLFVNIQERGLTLAITGPWPSPA